MFAVIKTGGKQYKVTAKDVITIGRLEGTEGDQIVFDSVLMVGGDKAAVGAPFVEGACVSAKLTKQTRGRKVLAFKKRRRKHSQKTVGHRQDHSVIEIDQILTGGAKPKKAAKPAVEAKAEEAPKAKAKAAPKAEAAPKAKAEAAPKAKAEAAPKAKAEAAPKAKAAPKAEKPAKAEAAPKAKAEKPAAKPKAKKAIKLTDIKGVGPVNAERLAEAGYTMADIASWSLEDLDRVDQELDLGGRGDVEDWIGQAKALIS